MRATGLREGTLCECLPRWECACISSQQQTHHWLHAVPQHPHNKCGCCGEVLSLVALPQQHHSSTHSAWMWDHIKRGGCIRCGTVRAKDLLNTYADGTNTGVRERSLVQSHVALHHIHQHSALSSLQTTLASAKHQSASQKCTSPEDTWLVAHCFLLSFSLVLKKISTWIKEKKRIPLVCHKQISTKSRSLSDSRLCENKHLHLWLTGLTTVVIYSLFEIQVFPIQLEHGLLHIGAVFW